MPHLAGVRIAYLASDQEKTKNGQFVFGECRKVSPMYAWCCPYDFMITIYEPNVVEYGFDDEQLRLLMWHELMHCGVIEDDSGVKYHIAPHDVEEFYKIIDEGGLRWETKNLMGRDPRG